MAARPTHVDIDALQLTSSACRYIADYPLAITELRRLPGLASSLLFTEQDAGSWLDRTGDEIVVSALIRGHVHAVADLGDGRFDGIRPIHGLMVIPPGQVSSIAVSGVHHVLSMDIALADLRRLMPEHFDGEAMPLHRLHRGMVTAPSVVEAMIGLWRLMPGDGAEATAAGEEALLTVAEQLVQLQSGRPPRWVGGLAPWQVRRVTDLIDSRAARPSLEAMAATVGLSPYHFARSFRRTVGQSPYRFAVDRAMVRACARLHARNETLDSIAEAAGYESGAAFAQAFRRRVGCTPQQWRELRRQAPNLSRTVIDFTIH